MFIAYTEVNQPGQWGGYVTFYNGTEQFPTNFILDISIAGSIMFIGEQADAQPALDVLRKAFDIPAVTMANEGWTNNDTWLKWHGEDKTDPAGLNAFMSTRLLQTENFETA